MLFRPSRMSSICSRIVEVGACVRRGKKCFPPVCWQRQFSRAGVQEILKDQRWKVMFFGTDHFSLPHLTVMDNSRRNGLLIDRLEVVVPESKYIKRRGRTRRMSPVWEFSQSQGLTCHQWPLRDVPSGFDVGVVVSFGHLLPRWLIQSFPLGILNVHPSLLPRWRGGAPIHHTILNGDSVTGVSIMRILPNKFDVGPILLQRECAVPDGSTTSGLSKVLATLGSDMLIEVLSDLIAFVDNETPQAETGLTLGLKVPSRMAWVDWDSSRQTIDRVFRALSEQMPLKTIFDGDEIRLEKMVPLTEYLDVSGTDAIIAGSISFDKRNNVICVRCEDGWVGFRAISPVGRKWMTAKEFHSGYLATPRRRSGDEPKRFTNCDLIKR